MSIIYTGRAVPFDGKRKLSAKEAQQRAKAMACIRSPQTTKCQGQVHVGLFFDGTGNNKDWSQEITEGKDDKATQQARNKHSNVARLWAAHHADEQQGFFKYYISGIGTPNEQVGDVGIVQEYVGSGFGFMGADRINWGITSVFNAVHRYVKSSDLLSAHEQEVLVNLMSTEMLRKIVRILPSEGAGRWAMLTATEEKLASVVKAHQRKVKQINISIFGFSRGAAQARACAHWLHQIFESESGAFELAGVPVRIGFMGIFDTVASVGVGDVTPVTFGHMAWAEGTQSVHPVVEECTHFVALHEQRGSFPLESATGRGNVGYPGMHSDVGGGYWPGEQGKAMPNWGASPHLSQIPLLDMHFAALRAGVPMLTIEEIKVRPKLTKSFSTDIKLIDAYNNWLMHNKIAPASLTVFTQNHTEQYLRWRGMLHEGKFASLYNSRFYKDSTEKDRIDLAEADRELGTTLRAWRERKDANSTPLKRAVEAGRDVVRLVIPNARLFVDEGKDPLSAHEDKFLTIMMGNPKPPDVCISLFEDYVHDSRAGFRVAGYHEPRWLTGGYAKYRHVFLQSKPNPQMYSAANESLKAVKAAADAAVTFFKSLYNQAVDTYEAARAKIIKTAKQVRDETVHAAIVTGKAVDAAAKEVAAKAEKTGKQILREANEAARIYHEAQKKIIIKYVKAQKELDDQLHKRWEKLNK
jgi:Uncharacterized alpha/beta hydrolase domain (DUF2235)